VTIEGPRALRKEELGSAIELADEVFRVGWGSSMARHYPLLLSEKNLDGLRVFVEDGKVVSLVGMLEREIVLLGTRHLAGSIGSVCTDPDYRGQGLATRLLLDARQKARRDGVDVFLISGSRGLYRRQDYVNVGDYHTCTIRRDQLPPPGRCVLRHWRMEDVPALVRLHAAEPVRFVRPPDDFVALLSCGQVVNRRGETRMVCQSGSDEPVGYVAYRLGGFRPQDRDTDTVTVAEMAGARWAVARVLGALLEEHDVASATVHYLASDVEFGEMARSCGWPTEPRGFPGTVGIIDAGRFWDACTPVFREKLGREFDALQFDAGPPVRIAHGREQLVLEDMSALTNLVFLPRHRRGELDLGLRDGSELAGILDELFPLPLVDYGLNYI